jgi:hypothetical protein
MLTDIPYLTSRFHDEMHNNKTWAATIREKAGGLPVVFMNSYQRPSKYWFYSGDTSFSLNTTSYRRNNYNFWPIEQQFGNRSVFLVDKMVLQDSGASPIISDKEITAGKIINRFESHSSIQLKPQVKNIRVSHRQLLPFEILISSSTGNTLRQSQHQIPMVLDIFSGDEYLVRLPLDLRSKDAHRSECFSNSDLNLPAAVYRAKLGLATSIPGIFSQNSPSIQLIIE